MYKNIKVSNLVKCKSSSKTKLEIMPRILYSSSDSDEEPQFKRTSVTSTTIAKKPSSSKRPIRDVLGEGKVADILLWRDRKLSGGILAGATIAWVLFEVIEYNFIALVCDISMIAMLLLFVLSSASPLFDRDPLKIPEAIIPEHVFTDVAFGFHGKLARLVSHLQDIASGKDLKMFLMIISSLWIISIIGSSCSFWSLLYLGYLVIGTTPALYERYRAEVDHLFARGSEDLKKFYKRLDSNVLKKIPRGPTKNKKFK